MAKTTGVTAQLIRAPLFNLHSKINPSIYFPNPNFQASSHLLWVYTRFVSNLVENPEDRFSHDGAHSIVDKFDNLA